MANLKDDDGCYHFILISLFGLKIEPLSLPRRLFHTPGAVCSLCSVCRRWTFVWKIQPGVSGCWRAAFAPVPVARGPGCVSGDAGAESPSL